jgi:hypothetical protein
MIRYRISGTVHYGGVLWEGNFETFFAAVNLTRIPATLKILSTVISEYHTGSWLFAYH